MDYFYYFLGFLFGLVCLFLILLILIQKGRGGGLSSAFGGAGGNTAFGSKTGDVLTWVTAVVFGIFLLLSMGMVWVGDSLYESENEIAAESANVLGSAGDDDAVESGPGADTDDDGLGTGGTAPLGSVEDPGDESLEQETGASDNPMQEPMDERIEQETRETGEAGGSDE